MASPARVSLSGLRFLDSRGLSLDAPLEGAPCVIQLEVSIEEWESIDLFRNGEPLPVYPRRLAGRTRVVADWPPCDPGRYRLALQHEDGIEEQVVTLWPRKLDRRAYAQLLEDVQLHLPAGIALGLQRAGALAGIEPRPPAEMTLAGELLRLRRAIEGAQSGPGLVVVLRQVARDPHRVLAAVEEWTPRERARRPPPARLAQATVRAGRLDRGGRPRQVIDSRVEPGVDVYENRLLKAFHDQVWVRLRRLLPVLEARRDGAPCEDAEALADRLWRARRRAGFLDGVGALEHAPARLTMVLLKAPAYRSALEGWLAFHRSASVRLAEPALDAPLENLPRLYQLWGTLQIVAVLLSAAETLGYRVERQRLVERDATGLFLRPLPGGAPAVTLRHPDTGARVDLIPERTYGLQGPLRSVTFRQRPDVAVEVWPVGGLPRVYLFDPKYRLDSERDPHPPSGSPPFPSPRKEDLDKMHAYRDAVRDEANRRVVRHAAILYPGPGVRYEGGIEALTARPGDEVEMRERLREVLGEALLNRG